MGGSQSNEEKKGVSKKSVGRPKKVLPKKLGKKSSKKMDKDCGCNNVLHMSHKDEDHHMKSPEKKKKRKKKKKVTTQ